MKTNRQFAEETFAFYNEDPKRRAVIETETDGRITYNCRYLIKSDDGDRKCAIGRFIKPYKYVSEMEGKSIRRIKEQFGNDVFEDDISDVNIRVLSICQAWHDFAGCWKNDATRKVISDYILEIADLADARKPIPELESLVMHIDRLILFHNDRLNFFHDEKAI